MRSERGGTASDIRMRDERARMDYYDHYKCTRCGGVSSVFHDEFQPGGPLCTPCRGEIASGGSSEVVGPEWRAAA